jgi:hypothetical protein
LKVGVGSERSRVIGLRDSVGRITRGRQSGRGRIRIVREYHVGFLWGRKRRRNCVGRALGRISWNAWRRDRRSARRK